MNEWLESSTKLLALSGRLFIPDIPVLEYCNRLWIPSSPYLLRSILTTTGSASVVNVTHQAA